MGKGVALIPKFPERAEKGGKAHRYIPLNLRTLEKKKEEERISHITSSVRIQGEEDTPFSLVLSLTEKGREGVDP